MVAAGALVVALGVAMLILSPRISRAYSGQQWQWLQRMTGQFTGVILIVVGAPWIAGK
jgi:hypothetical protein